MSATTRRLATTLLLGASLMVSCSSPAERAIERSAPGTDVEIERDGGRIVIEDDDGSLTVETGGELPEQIRDAFSVPADYSVDFTSTVTDGTTSFVSVSGHLERSDLRTLTEELTGAITAAGWTVVMSFSSGENGQLIGASRDDQELQISIVTEPGSSRFDVIINVSMNTE
jgi:hypothetical protein